MILSRQQKPYQTWHGQNSHSRQRHALSVDTNNNYGASQVINHVPQEKPTNASQKPALSNSMQLQARTPSTCWTTTLKQPTALAQSDNIASVRASTLNRLDQLRRHQRMPAANPQTTASLRRNLSALGHYDGAGGRGSSVTPTHYHFAGLREPDRQVYAPASIASPRELIHRPAPERPVLVKTRWPQQAPTNPLPPPSPPPPPPPPRVETNAQHYASASVGKRLENACSKSMAPERPRSVLRPDSALGQLIERFGTLKRKARKHWSGRSWSRSNSRTVAGGQPIYTPASEAGFPLVGARPPCQPLVLDPEIYASGKRQVEADEIYAEGTHALDSNAQRRLLEHELDPALMAEGETRTLIDAQSRRRADFNLLVTRLTSWTNDELADQRIIVRDLQDDLWDGQVLCKLFERLQRVKLDTVEVTQNEAAQKRKLGLVLSALNRVFTLQARSWATIRWSVDGIHSKSLVEILSLLITMALYYRAPIRLPADVQVQVYIFQRQQGELVCKTQQVQLTDAFVRTALERLSGLSCPVSTQWESPIVSSARQEMVSERGKFHLAIRKKDAFDALLERAPDKLALVEQSLATFCNRHLSKIRMSCRGDGSDCHVFNPSQFSDGLLLVFLISSLEDYFVPLGTLFTSAAMQISSGGPNSDVQLSSIDEPNSNGRESIEQATALEPTSYVNSQSIKMLHNVNIALQLIEEAGLTQIRQHVKPEEIVNGDLKAVLRVLYALFSRYKHL